METKATDDPFYTPRSSARRGYSSGGSEDERFTSPRTSARSVSSDENDFKTPREGSIASPRDGAIHPTSGRATAGSSEDYYKRAMGKPQPRLNLNELKYALPDEYADAANAKKTGRTSGYDQEYKAQAFGRGTQASARDSARAGVADMRSPRSVEAPAVEENDIFSAARHNRIDSVTYMLDQGLSVNLRDSYGNTILSIACQNGLKRMAKLALRRGTNINSQNNRGNTALHFCFAYGYGDTLGEYLISKGADTTIANQDGLLCFDGIDPRSPRNIPSTVFGTASLGTVTARNVTTAAKMGNYRMGFGGDNDRISAARDPRDGDSDSGDDGDHGMGSAGSQRRDLGRQSNVEMEDSPFDDRDHDRENEDPRDHYDQQHRTTYGGPTVRNIGNQRAGRAASTGRRSGYLSDDTDIEEEMMRIDPVDLEWRRQLHEGDPIDAQNLFGNWCPAMILRILDGEVRVRYLNMNDSWQRWLPVDSGQLAQPATKTRNDSAPLRLAQIVEVRKPGTSIWKEAHVVKARPSDLLVRYAGRQQQFDDWMPFTPENVAASGDHVRLRSALSEQRRLSVKPNINRNRVIQAQNPRFQHYRDALAAQGLRIHSVEGDGNCLFRAVSHQVYGDDRHHELVRGYCMDYMESEKEYFEPYVVGDMSAFLRYLQHKRRNGVWGDDPEIQAMCELYDRPAEVYAYDPTSGFRKLRTFHENSALSRNRPPICLSYYGGGHYDSIVGPLHASNIIRESPGQWEQHHLEISRRINTREGGEGNSDEQVPGTIPAQRVPAAAASGAATTTTEMDQLERILLMSRNEFDAMGSNLDDTLKQAIAESEVTAVSSEQRAVDEATRESEIAAIQAELLEKARQASEEEQMRKALEASVKEQNIPHHALDYDDDVSAAIAASLVEHSSLVPPGGLDTFTPVDEEEEMRRILELSAKEYEASSRSFESATTNESTATSHLDYAFHDDVPGLVDADEMDELQRAIQASLSES